MKALEKPNLAVDVEVLACAHFVSTKLYQEGEDVLHICRHCREFFLLKPDGRKVILRSHAPNETKPVS